MYTVLQAKEVKSVIGGSFFSGLILKLKSPVGNREVGDVGKG